MDLWQSADGRHAISEELSRFGRLQLKLSYVFGLVPSCLFVIFIVSTNLLGQNCALRVSFVGLLWPVKSHICSSTANLAVELYFNYLIALIIVNVIVYAVRTKYSYSRNDIEALLIVAAISLGSIYTIILQPQIAIISGLSDIPSIVFLTVIAAALAPGTHLFAVMVFATRANN